MVVIRLHQTAKGQDIDLPPSVAHRSVDGNTLILQPGSTKELTDDEFAYISKTYPTLLSQITVC